MRDDSSSLKFTRIDLVDVMILLDFMPMIYNATDPLCGIDYFDCYSSIFAGSARHE